MNSKKLQSIINDDGAYLFQTYTRQPVSFARGEGSYLYDQDGRRYIDFLSGIAVNLLGYGHPRLLKTLHKQLDVMLHTSNLFLNSEQIAAAKLLSKTAFPGRTFFSNSGTEANEAAIKLARRHGRTVSNEKFRIISFEGSFHGRTFGAMAATGNEKIKKGFEPLMEGFTILPYNDIDSFLSVADGAKYCAVLTELIQGEGGIRPATREFASVLVETCKKHNMLLIIDEVQTGLGRTGKPFAFQHYNLKPDAITLAKGLAAGLPLGALHARTDRAGLMEKGSHASTFGGNHLSCAAARVVLEEIAKPSFFKNMSAVSAYIFDRLATLKKELAIIADIRGKGLHVGIELTQPGAPLVGAALARGLVINCTSERVLRLMPPLTVSRKTAREALDILEELLRVENGTQ